MHERQFTENLVDRYLTNRATDDELAVFLELLRQGELDELIQAHMDQDADPGKTTPVESSPFDWFTGAKQWLKVAAQLALISSDFWVLPA